MDSSCKKQPAKIHFFYYDILFLKKYPQLFITFRSLCTSEIAAGYKNRQQAIVCGRDKKRDAEDHVSTLIMYGKN